MKKVLIFIAGIVTGAILMLVIAALIGNSSNGESSNNGMTFFEKEGDCISENNFEVFQVLDSGDALANEIDELSISTGLMVLFLCDAEALAHFIAELERLKLGVLTNGEIVYDDKNEKEVFNLMEKCILNKE